MQHHKILFMRKTSILAVIALLFSMLTSMADAKGNNRQFEALMSQAEGYMNVNDTYHAMGCYEQAFQWSASPRISRALAKCYFARGYYRKCLNCVNGLPEDSISHHDMKLKYDCYNNMSMNDSALYWSRRIADKYPYDSENIAQLANYYNDAENPDSALLYISRYHTLDTANIFVNRQQAYAHYLKKYSIISLHEYRRLMEMGDHSLLTYYRMGLCYNDCDSLNKAYYCFMNACKLSGFQNTNMLARLGMVSIKIGNYYNGIEYLRLALKIMQPEADLFFVINNYLADGYLATQQNDFSIDCLKECLKYDSEHYSVIYKLAQIYELKHDAANEKFYFQKFLDVTEKIDKPEEALVKLMGIARNKISEINANTKHSKK